MAKLRGKDLVLPEKSLFEMFLDLIVEGLGERAAVIHNGKWYNVKDLHDMSQHIARSLRLGMDQSQIIGVLVPPSIHRVASMLGILSIGAAYLPLDTTLPPEKVKTALQETLARVILVTKETASFLKHEFFNNLEILVIQVDELMDSDERAFFNEGNVDDPLVCVLYTSGSTGISKGVKLHHRNVLNRLSWYWDQFPFSRDDIGCHKTSSLFFDSVTEILSHVLKGVPLVILDKETVENTEEFLEAVHSQKVTRLTVVPSLLQAMVTMNDVKKGNYFQHLQQVICSGEALSPNLAKEFLATAPMHCSLANFYGSTETTGDVTFIIFNTSTDVEQFQNDGYLATGLPVANTEVCILGQNKELMDIGSEGDICIAGLNVTYGFIQGTDYSVMRTKEGMVVHNTGDKGVIRNGILYYAGRRDSQIKVRGQRINMMEIERVIQSLDMIKTVVVLACDGASLLSEIPVAFFSTKGDDMDFIYEEMVEKVCKKKLPEYMYPHLFKVEHVPLQIHTGKVDRQKLRDLYHQSRQLPSEEMRPFAQGEKDDVIKILSQITGAPTKSISRGKCFFALGGNSLSAVMALKFLKKAGFDVTLSGILKSPDVLTYLEESTKVDDRSLKRQTINDELDNYNIQMIVDNTFKESVKSLLAKEFVTKNPLDVLAGTTEDGFATLLDSFFEQIIKDKLSYVMLNDTTGTVDACTVSLDIETQISPKWAQEAVGEINDAVEAPVKQRLQEQGGKWMDYMLNAVDSGIEPAVRVLLLLAMEDHIIKLGRERHYDGIITVNSNPVTLALAEAKHGYTVESTVYVRDFQFRGDHPFKEATPDYCIKCMIKTL